MHVSNWQACQHGPSLDIPVPLRTVIGEGPSRSSSKQLIYKDPGIERPRVFCFIRQATRASQRKIKGQTGGVWDDLCGENTDSKISRQGTALQYGQCMLIVVVWGC
jgi:hypothetical protein